MRRVTKRRRYGARLLMIMPMRSGLQPPVSVVVIRPKVIMPRT